MKAITINNLKKNYGKVKAVDNISFYVEKGDFFGFIGPNGAGKTTTINSIMGLVKFEGEISVLGHDVIKDYKETRKKIGFSPQDYNFDRFLTVYETLLYTAGYFGIKKKDASKRIDQLLKKFNLENKRNVMPDQLSGGMRRRLIIARALVNDPEILILDEPTAGIDVQLRRELWTLLKEINKEGTTIILTSHYIEEVETLCDTVCIINKGKIIEMGKKEKIMEDLGDQTLQIKTDKRIPENLISNNFVVAEKEDITKISGKGIRKKAKKILKDIEKAGIEIKEIDITQEKLEDVFLRLTGEKK